MHDYLVEVELQVLGGRGEVGRAALAQTLLLVGRYTEHPQLLAWVGGGGGGGRCGSIAR